MTKGILFMLAAPSLLLAQPAIQSFTAACTSTSTPGAAVTCTAGDNDILAWNVTNATSLSIDQGVGAVRPLTIGSVVVQPFSVSSITYTLLATASDGGQSTAMVTITVDDYFARVSAWPSVVRYQNFDSSVTQTTTGYADPGQDASSLGAGGDGTFNNAGLDTTKAVSGPGSFKFTIPAVAGQDPSGSVHIDFSSDALTSFGQGQEFFVQWREYMDHNYVYNVYLAGAACSANLTLSGVSGTFQNGETITSGAASARVTSWNIGTGVLIGGSPNAYLWIVGANVTGGTSGAHGTIASNNGGGLTAADCSGDTYNTGMKQFIISPQDQPPLPLTAQQNYAKSCMASHIVMTNNEQQSAGQMYSGCPYYDAFTPTYFPGTSPGYLDQSAIAGCSYTGNSAAGVPLKPPCVLYDDSAWTTYQVHVKVGTWYLVNAPGYPTATFTVSGGAVQAITVSNEGANWAYGSTITLSDALGSFGSGSGASATCAVDQYGGIPACTVTAGGSGHTSGTVRWPAHFGGSAGGQGGNLRRDTTIERWQASPGMPSVLVDSMVNYDVRNDSPSPNDGGNSDVTTSFPNPPYNYGKMWFLPYSTGRDVNAGPYPVAHTWFDNMLVGTVRFPDPGVAVQPPTDLTISIASYPSITLSWLRSMDDQGNYNEAGFTIQRCPGQVYDCMAGSTLVSGATWSTAGTVGAGVTTYAETVPSSSQIYTYRVYSTGPNNSTYSNPVSTAPHPPYNLVAGLTTTGAVYLSWVQGDDVGAFSVERCTGAFQQYKVNGTSGEAYDSPDCLTTGTSVLSGFPLGTASFAQIGTAASVSKGATVTYLDSTATPGTTYTYRVRSLTAAGSWRNWHANSSTYWAYTGNVMPTFVSCDLTGDGKVDNADVQFAVNQTVNLLPCRTGGAGTCNVVSVQNVICTVLGLCACAIP